MNEIPPCPKCQSPYAYQDGALLVCPECAYEWNLSAPAEKDAGPVYKDVNGTVLADGDMVTLIKDLKVKGTSKTVKVGTKVRIQRLTEGDHDIDCKIDGIGSIKLKTQFVKKA